MDTATERVCMESVQVAGIGLTHFGQHPERTCRDLFGEAGVAALSDSGVDREDIEALMYGNFMGEISDHQGHMGPLAAEAVGLDVPATRFESACASSATAVREAVMDIRNGEYDVVLVGGAERMTNISTEKATDALALAADDLYEISAGMTFPGAYALMARAYFEEYGGSHEDLAHIAVKNHQNALDNEYAQYHEEISVEDVLDAPPVAKPLGLYDACPLTDGASAAVLVSEEYADTHDLDAPVGITGTGQGGDNIALQDRKFLARTPAAEKAASEAYDDAGITANDVDVVEVHDCFTIAEVMAIEAIGLYEPGEGIDAARNGETTRDGPNPVNLSGGLKAKGHPVGATGTNQIAALTRLLQGDHPNSDALSETPTAVAHNAGGTAASTAIHVLEVMDP
jgi:acetyl-CoA acetyltransferase